MIDFDALLDRLHEDTEAAYARYRSVMAKIPLDKAEYSEARHCWSDLATALKVVRGLAAQQ